MGWDTVGTGERLPGVRGVDGVSWSAPWLSLPAGITVDGAKTLECWSFFASLRVVWNIKRSSLDQILLHFPAMRVTKTVGFFSLLKA